MKEQKALAIFDFFVQKVIFWFGVDTSIVRHNYEIAWWNYTENISL